MRRGVVLLFDRSSEDKDFSAAFVLPDLVNSVVGSARTPPPAEPEFDRGGSNVIGITDGSILFLLLERGRVTSPA